MLIGLAGVALLLGPDMLLQPDANIWGEVACLGAAFVLRLHQHLRATVQSHGIDPMEAASGQVTASALLILPIMLIVDRQGCFPRFHR